MKCSQCNDLINVCPPIIDGFEVVEYVCLKCACTVPLDKQLNAEINESEEK